VWDPCVGDIINTLGGIFLPFTMSETRGWTVDPCVGRTPLVREGEGLHQDYLIISSYAHLNSQPTTAEVEAVISGKNHKI
jgi:hypothetical protein